MPILNLKTILFYLYLTFTFFYNFSIAFDENLLKNNINLAIFSSSSTLFLFYLFVIYEKRNILKKLIIFLGIMIIYLIIDVKISLNTIYSFIFNASFSLDNIYKLIRDFFSSTSFLLIILGIINYVLRIKSTNKDDDPEKLILYSERREDSKEVYNFLTNVNNKIEVLAINGNFGVGKTFLIDYTLDELKNSKEYEILKIRCLTLEKEDIYCYLSNQLNRILIKNLIFTGHSKKIKRTVAAGLDNKLGGISNLLTRETSVDDIENFKKAIMKLKKTVIIVFDDIDRLFHSEKIDKILSFISDFSIKNVKILMLYNSTNLYNINQKYNRNYLEKFIPYTIDLTNLKFSSLLKKEIEIHNLNQDDFKFLYTLDTPEYLVYDSLTSQDYQLQRKELEFIYGFEKLTNKQMNFTIEVTPRKIKFFLDEAKKNLDIFKSKIDNRIIIGYTFLKHFMYEDFYEKINLNETFENIFKVELKAENINEPFSLQELDLVKNLIKIKENLKKISDNDDHIIRINNKRVFLHNDNYRKQEENLNYYLKKFNIEPVENKTEFYKNLVKLDKKISLLSNIIIPEESYNKIMIYRILNYHLYIENNINKVMEINQSIHYGIKQLKFLGFKKSTSQQKILYKYICDVLDNSDIQIQLEKYNEFLKNSNYFEGLYLLGNTIEEIIITIFNIFEDKERVSKYLRLIFFKNKNKITDNYIKCFIKADIKIAKESDFIIRNILKNRFEFKNLETIHLIKKNITKFMIRKDFYDLDDLDDKLDVIKFFNNEKNDLKKILNQNNPYRYNKIFLYPEIKKFAKLYINFINKIIEIFKYNNFEEKIKCNVHYSESRYHEFIQNIIDMKTLEEKKIAFVKLSESEKTFDELKQINEIIFKEEI